MKNKGNISANRNLWMNIKRKVILCSLTEDIIYLKYYFFPN